MHYLHSSLSIDLYASYRWLLSRVFYFMHRMFFFDTLLYISVLTLGASAVSIYLRTD